MKQALVIVDFQNDFCPGGALAVPDGDAIAGRVNELAASSAGCSCAPSVPATQCTGHGPPCSANDE